MAGNLFPHLIRVKAKSTTNTTGGQVVSYSPGTSVACLVSPAGTNLQLFYAQRNSKITHELYTMKAVTANVDDLIVFGSRQFVVRGIRNVLESSRLYVLDAYELLGTEQVVYDFGG